MAIEGPVRVVTFADRKPYENEALMDASNRIVDLEEIVAALNAPPLGVEELAGIIGRARMDIVTMEDAPELATLAAERMVCAMGRGAG